MFPNKVVKKGKDCNDHRAQSFTPEFFPPFHLKSKIVGNYETWEGSVRSNTEKSLPILYGAWGFYNKKCVRLWNMPFPLKYTIFILLAKTYMAVKVSFHPLNPHFISILLN